MDKGGTIVGKGHVLGVCITAVGADTMSVAYVYLQRKRDGVHVHAQGVADGPKTLAALMGTRIPVALTFATDRCVHRVLDRTGEAEDLLREAFPNAPLEELITSLWRTGSRTGTSMARRNAVIAAIAPFSEAGFRVVRAMIGPWSVMPLRDLLEETDAPWRIGGYAFDLQDGALHNVSRDAAALRTIELDGDRIEGEHVLAFATAWEHLSPTAERMDLPVAELRPAQQQEKARVSYELGLVVAIALFVVLIGGERIVSHQLQRAQVGLRTSATAHSADMQAVEDLQQRVAEMERVGSALGNGRNERLALQAARIAASVPADIRLERLMERPLRSPLKEKTPFETAAGVVGVQGACTDARALDAWMTTLKQLPGVASVKLTAYGVDAEDGRPRFQLELGP